MVFHISSGLVPSERERSLWRLIVSQLAVQVPGQADLVVKGLQSLYDNTSLLSRLNDLPRNTVHATVKTAAIVLQMQIVDFTRKSILWMRKAFFAKFAGCFVAPDEVKDALEELKLAQRELLSSMDFDSYISKKWDTIFTARRETLNKMCSDEVHEAQLLKHKMLHSSRLPSSADWAINDKSFQEWIRGDIGILWCPGLGKLALIYQLFITRLTDTGQLVPERLTWCK